MSDVQLGATPATMRLVLTEGADFICTLTSSDGDWPGTAVIAIVTGETTWTATLSGPDATFNVDKAQVDALIATLATAPARFRLIVTDGTADLVWGRGPVSVSRV